MTSIRSRAGLPAALALAFAVFLAMMLVLAGRLDDSGLTLALVAGTVVASLIVAGRPIKAFRTMSNDSRASAFAGGALAFFASPAIIAAARMSDAPAGSVVVFWIAGGWSAIAAATAALLAWRSGRSSGVLLSVAGGAAALVGTAAVVANWERPSSFSPLVRFPMQEMAILGAGALFVVGGLLLLSAKRSSGLSGTLVAGSASAGIAAVVWFLLADPARALASIGELPVQVAIAAIAWGALCALLLPALDGPGLPSAAASMAVAPVLISALTWVEQAAGVAGPQPFIVSGVLAGSVVALLSALVLLVSGRVVPPVRRPLWLTVLAAVPLVAAIVALFLPALTAAVDVDSAPAFFKGSWTMPGLESVAAWVAVALAAVLLAAVFAARTGVLPFVGAIACMAWFMLRDVPTHVLNNWLSPAVQSYYGTEYGSISFTAVLNPPMLFAVTAAGVGFLALAVAGFVSRRPARPNPVIDSTTEV